MTSCTLPLRLLPYLFGAACATMISTTRAQPLDEEVTIPTRLPGQTRIDADTVDGQLETELIARGNVVVTQDQKTLCSEWLDYYLKPNRVKAGDHFTLTQPNDQIKGKQLDYFLDTHTGTATAPTFSSIKRGYPFRGNGTQAEFTGPNRYRIRDAYTTTCAPGNEAWYLKSSTLDLDYTRNVGVARHATLVFQGVPIAYTPWIDFPLDEGRKSGFLLPSLTTGSNGNQLSVPYYWNIAPNYDATITPQYNTLHGASLATEFRYLAPKFSGLLYTEQLPHDALTDEYRYLWFGRHYQQLFTGLGVYYNATTVSDDAYFRDFGDRMAIAANVNLLREAGFTYGQGGENGSLRSSLKVQRYQTLQDPANPYITPPYASLPKLTLQGKRTLPYDFTALFSSDFSAFSHPTQQEGNRFVVYPQLNWEQETTWGYIRPQLGVHYTQYQLTPFNSDPARTLTRSLPIGSIDGGLFFERETTFQHQNYLHTLEPRLYYVYIPTRVQSQFPNFDTSLNDPGFAQLFTENRFSGEDRINGANQISAGLTSRLISHNTGLETLRATVGQRFYLQETEIALSGAEEKQTKRWSDLFLGLGGDLSPTWHIDSMYQYNNKLAKTERYSIRSHYNPKPGKILSIRYIYGRDEPITAVSRGFLHQVDIGAQWPITQKWHIVARDNYSLVDKTHLERLAGIEYNAGCWALRVVGQRYVVDTLSTKTAWFVQLALKGIGGLGSRPLQKLRLAIPGYTSVADPI